MEQPPFMKLMFKLFSVLGAKGKLSNFLLFLTLSISSFFSVSTISCMNASKEEKNDSFLKLHDLLAIFILLSSEVFTTANKAHVRSIIKLLTEPIIKVENNPMYLKLFENYNKELKLCCKVFITSYTVAALSWYVSLITLWYSSSNDGHEECIHLGIGWVWKLESDLILIFAITILMFISIPRLYIYYLVMFCMLVNIKYKIRLLRLDLEAVNRSMSHPEDQLESNPSYPDSQWRAEEKKAQVQTKTASRAINTHHRNVSSRLQTTKEANESMDLFLQKYLREKIRKDRVKFYLKNMVEQHLDIITRVNLMDKTFRHAVMVLVQTGVIVVALAIPKLSLNNEFLRPEYAHRGIETLFMMGFMGLLNYCGQIVLDESELLRQTLYNCDWTEKPQDLKKGLLIMQTVATKPLKLTIGGIYTLSLETYGNIVRAAYSYISVIQSLNSKEH